MAIQFRCACGKALQVGDEFAGRLVRCPGCQEKLVVPQRAAPQGAGERERTRAGKPSAPPPRHRDEEYERDDDFRETDRPRRRGAPPRKRGLWPWILAASLLLLVVGGGISAWLLLKRGGGGALPPDLALVPADAQGFITIRVADAWNLPESKKIRQQLPPDVAKEIAGFEAKVGVALDDLERLTFVATDVTNKEMWVVFALSKPYDRQKILALFPPGTQEVKHGNTSYHLTPGRDDTGIHFFDDRIVVVGSSSGIKRYLEQVERKTTAGPLAAALRTAAGKHHLVAAAAPPAQLLQPLKSKLPPDAAAFSAFLDLRLAVLVMDQADQTLTFDLSMDFPDGGKADEAKTAIEALLALGKVALPALKARFAQGPLAPEIEQVAAWADKTLKSIKPEKDGSTVKVNLKIDYGEVSETLAKLGFNLAGGVQNVRQAAAKTQNANNMKQLALAMHIYADARRGQMPSAAIHDQKGRRLLSWRVELLPYLEQQALYNEFHRDEPWNSPHNMGLLSRMPAVFRLPGDPEQSTMTHYQVFTGPGTPFVGKLGPNMPRTFRDGTSNTILIVEAARGVPWTKPEDLTNFPGRPILPRLGGHYGDLFYAALADGSVFAVPKTISDQTLRNAINPADGMPLGPDWPGR
jgi:hypothetical protein